MQPDELFNFGLYVQSSHLEAFLLKHRFTVSFLVMCHVHKIFWMCICKI